MEKIDLTSKTSPHFENNTFDIEHGCDYLKWINLPIQNAQEIQIISIGSEDMDF